VIAAQLSTLPPWLRLFVTSREEPQIKAALAKFEPKELRADEKKNRADVEVYLRKIARDHVKNELSMADLEADIKRTFRIDMQGRMNHLQQEVNNSCEIYGEARTKLQAREGFGELLAIQELRPDAQQQSDDFATVYAKAREAQRVLTSKVASEWEPDKDRRVGAKWKEVGSSMPTLGTEICNETLARLLHQKKAGKNSLELTEEELLEAAVGTLSSASFIKVDGEYMEVSVIQHPKNGKALAWVEFADDPGIKGEPRSREKMKND